MFPFKFKRLAHERAKETGISVVMVYSSNLNCNFNHILLFNRTHHNKVWFMSMETLCVWSVVVKVKYVDTNMWVKYVDDGKVCRLCGWVRLKWVGRWSGCSVWVRYVSECEVFGYSMWGQRVGKVCGGSVWVRYVGAVCGGSVWGQCVGKVCGGSVWVRYVGAVCGGSVWGQCVGKVCGGSVWGQCVGAVCG